MKLWSPKVSRFDKVLHLSEREHEILLALGAGMSPDEITRIPGMCGYKTVHSYIRRIRDKLGVESLFRLICLASAYYESGLKRELIVPRHPRYRFTK